VFVPIFPDFSRVEDPGHLAGSISGAYVIRLTYPLN